MVGNYRKFRSRCDRVKLCKINYLSPKQRKTQLDYARVILMKKNQTRVRRSDVSRLVAALAATEDRDIGEMIEKLLLEALRARGTLSR